MCFIFGFMFIAVFVLIMPSKPIKECFIPLYTINYINAVYGLYRAKFYIYTAIVWVAIKHFKKVLTPLICV